MESDKDSKFFDNDSSSIEVNKLSDELGVPLKVTSPPDVGILSSQTCEALKLLMLKPNKEKKADTIVPTKSNILISRIPANLESEVLVTDIKNPNMFSVQRAKTDKDDLEMLAYNILLATDDIEDEQMEEVLVGELYLGKFSVDHSWYRCIVKEKLDDLYRVEYIDYGNSEDVPLSRFRKCPESLSLENIPPYRIRCSLSSLDPINGVSWSKDACDLFKDIVVGITLQMMTKGSIEDDGGVLYQVDLHRSFNIPGISFDPPISVRECLVILGFGCFTSEEQVEKSVLVSCLPWARSYYKPHIELCANLVGVRVISCISPSEMWLQLSSCVSQYINMMKQLQAHCCIKTKGDLSNGTLYLPKQDILCCAHSAIDKKWYRATILNVPKPGEVTVHLVDIGRKETLPWYDLKKIPDRFAKEMAQQAFQCCLVNIKPNSSTNVWQTDVCENYHSFIYKNQGMLRASFVSRHECVYEISLFVRDEDDNDISVGKCLVDYSMARWDGVTNSLENTITARHDKFVSRYATDPPISVNYDEDSRSIKYTTPGRMQTEIIKPEISTECRASEEDKVRDYDLHFVELLSVSSPAAIHARFKKQTDAFASFQESVDTDVKQYLSAVDPEVLIEVGRMCAVKLPRKEHYYRGKILHCSKGATGNKVSKIHLIDIGEVKDVTSENIFAIPSATAKKLPLSFTLSLFGIEPPCGKKQWPSTTNDELIHILGDTTELFFRTKDRPYRDQSFFLIKTMPADIGFTVCVTGGALQSDVPCKIWLANRLVDLGMALPIRSLSKERTTNEKVASKESLIQETRTLLDDINFKEKQESHVKKYASFNPFQKDIDTELPKMELTGNNIVKENETIHSEKDQSVEFGTSCDHLVRDPYPPAPLPKEKSFLAEITFVDGACCFYLHPFSNRAKFEEMDMVHTFHFGGSAMMSNEDLNFQVGDPVVAKYHLNGKWYRAVVIEREEYQVYVDFIDFGNRESVRFTEIRKTVPFKDSPILCYRCELSNVIPIGDGYSGKALDYVHQMFVTKDCKVTVMSEPILGETLKVHIESITTGTDLSHFLVKNLMVARFIAERDPLPQALEDAKEDVVIETNAECLEVMTEGSSSAISNLPDLIEPTSSSEGKSHSLIEENAITEDEDIISPSNGARNFLSMIEMKEHPVFVSALLDPSLVIIIPNFKCTNEVYLDDSSQLQNILLKLKNSIKETAEECDIVEAPEIGSIYLAYCSHSQIWHRAQILSHEDNENLVFYIDLGIEGKSSRIRKCPVDILNIPKFSCLVKLKGIYPSDEGIWMSDSLNAMQKCLLGKDGIFVKIEEIEIEKDIQQVVLFCEDEEGESDLCYRDLVDKGLLTLEDE